MAESESPRQSSSTAQTDSSSSKGTSSNLIDSASKLIQVLSVVAGVIFSVLSFNTARETEAHAREAEAKTREVEANARAEELRRYDNQRRDEAEKKQTEAAKPFLELRQKLYLEAVQAAGVLANPDPKDHTEAEVKKARTRFRELYVAELSMVESSSVASLMRELAEAVDPELTTLTKEQKAALHLAHALRDSLVKSWNLNEKLVDNPSR